MVLVLVVLSCSVRLLAVDDRLPSSLATTFDYLYTSSRQPLAPFLLTKNQLRSGLS